MGQAIFYIIVIYILYKFITGFLIPVIRATGQMKSNINQMKDQMKGTQGPSTQEDLNTKKPNQPKPSKHDYIDFEEIKE